MIMPGRAVAALEAVVLPERLLQRVQRRLLGAMPSIVVTSAPSAWTASTRAALHRLAVEVDGARAAVGRVAADVRAGEPERVAQEVDQQQARFDLGALLQRR